MYESFWFHTHKHTHTHTLNKIPINYDRITKKLADDVLYVVFC